MHIFFLSFKPSRQKMFDVKIVGENMNMFCKQYYELGKPYWSWQQESLITRTNSNIQNRWNSNRALISKYFFSLFYYFPLFSVVALQECLLGKCRSNGSNARALRCESSMILNWHRNYQCHESPIKLATHFGEESIATRLAYNGSWKF